MASDVETLGTGPVTHAKFTANLGIVNTAVEAATLARFAALQLTAQRGGNAAVAWSPEPDFPTPPWLFESQNEGRD